MVGPEGVDAPLKPVETLRAMVALQDSNPSGSAKRFYDLANPRTAAGKVARYVLRKQAFTLDILVHELQMPLPTLYGVIREFESLAVIYKGYSIDENVRGAKPIMYVLAEADPAKIAEAHKFHLELRAPSEGVGMENHLRQLVAPFIMGAIELVKPAKGGVIPEDRVKVPFVAEYGYYSDEVRSAVHRKTRELGYNIRYSGL